MRAREIIEEDYNQSLDSDLMNLLINAKGNGKSQIKTQDIVNQLDNMGYAVDINSVISLLSGNSAVINVTPETIVLTSQDSKSSDDSQDSAARVSDMAAKASKL